MKKEKPLVVHAVILAGGRGTRFWPRSRTRTPKQLLNIVGEGSMLQQTVARLKPLVPPQRIWTVTNSEHSSALAKQLSAAARNHVLAEPLGRNTAAAIALAAIHVRHAAGGDALLAVLPADHFIAQFKEKPDLATAKEYVASGNFHWNAGMFFWRVSTFLDALKEFLPKTHSLIEELSKHVGKRSYAAKLKRIYPRLENISVDYAILERATQRAGAPRVFVIPAEMGWSDIGSWAAVHELLAKHPAENIFAGPGHSLDAEGNFLWSPGKYIAVIGVTGLVVVETPDALLICPRDRAQDVGKIVKALEDRKHKKLL